ncbi:MAG TPA: glucans biosynthesis glucosyltransferase MdoH [Acetobacteraceae bacterium]|jgi:membrane glycosyltransferase|nr:glucans biosynthesis glucosyltransferase MdoH [Acetobacteraceae bacterium]
MIARRVVIAGTVICVASGLIWLLCLVLAPGGWTLAKLVMLVGLTGTAPWTGLCLANGLSGFAARMLRGATADAPPPTDLPPLVIAVTLRDEALAPVLVALRRLHDALATICPYWTVTGFILSDTAAPGAIADEEACMASLNQTDRRRIRYRRRSDNFGFKAGNIMEFLDHHAEGFEFMLMLDADSVMSPDAVLRLASRLQADPHLGIVQHLTVGVPAASPLPRLFQFGMRAGMRIWAAGQDWWQGDAGPYWGHNAMLRIAPFRAHARLPLLPDGRSILSHDQVEAALLCGAGWGVRVVADEDGSWEAFPPALPEHLGRELRWLAGNLQYRHLFRLPGMHAMGRWQLLQAILLFAGAPFWMLFLLGAAGAAATDHVSTFPMTPALVLTLAWAGALYAPKLLGYLEVLLLHEHRARYGGGARFMRGMLAETVFTLLYDAIGQVSKTIAIVRLACGAHAGWAPQNRTDRGVGWREATRLCGAHTALGLVVFAAFACAGWHAALWAAPLVGGLLVSIPFAMITADRRFGRWLQRRGIAMIPEEIEDEAFSRAAVTA